MAKPIYISSKALEELKKEFHELKFVKRPELSKAIETARLHGDLTENAEYDAAREEQRNLLRRIAQLEETLISARPLEGAEIAGDACYIGCTVTLEDLEDGSEEEYTLVSPPEADPRRGKLSVESPIGNGLLGTKVGETIVVNIPAGEVRFRVISIER